SNRKGRPDAAAAASRKERSRRKPTRARHRKCIAETSGWILNAEPGEEKIASVWYDLRFLWSLSNHVKGVSGEHGPRRKDPRARRGRERGQRLLDPRRHGQRFGQHVLEQHPDAVHLSD